MSGIVSNEVSDAFDADVLVFLAKGLPIARSIRRALDAADGIMGSVVLMPELLSKPMRLERAQESADLLEILSRFELKEVTLEIANASTTLAAKYNLKAADAIHLATAIVWGAERFHTNNRKDFGPHISEVEVVWPEG